MSHLKTIGIVGGGLAAASAAAALRTEGFDGDVVIVSDEAWVPYERPPLTKGYLAGTADEASTYAFPPAFYESHDIDLIRSTRVTMLDTSRIRLDDDRYISFDSLLVATGSAARSIDAVGADLQNVLSIRTLDDARTARSLLRAESKVVCIGAGWIGLEVAATARSRGCEVTVVAPNSVPLSQVLGPEVGAFYQRAHEDQGVRFHLGHGVSELLGRDAVRAVLLDDDTRIEADVVVIGIGATPRISLLESAGAALALGGVATDASLQTSLPDVWAAGDIAAAHHPVFGTRVRVEHWANALHQGPCAARNMLGAREEYDRIPYFYSDQYDLSMEYAGLAPAWSRVIVRPGSADRSFLAFWLDESNVVLAGMTMNVPGAIDAVEDLVRVRLPVDCPALADPDVPLASTLARHESHEDS